MVLCATGISNGEKLMAEKTLRRVAGAKLFEFMRRALRFERLALSLMDQDIVPWHSRHGRGKVLDSTDSSWHD